MLNTILNFHFGHFIDAKPFDWLSLLVNATLIILGFIVAFAIYFKQRNDAAKDASLLFQDCLEILNETLSDTIKVLDEYKNSMADPNDEIRNPSLPTALNDKFLSRIDLPSLMRYYKNHHGKQGKKELRTFLQRSNFLGAYFDIFINEVNYFRSNFHEMELRFKKHQLLIGPMYFKVREHRNTAADLNFLQEYNSLRNKIGTSPAIVKNGTVVNRSLLNEQFVVPLLELSGRFILNDSLANEVNHMANEVNSARIDIEALKSSTAKVVDDSIHEFREIQIMIRQLIVKK